MRIGIPKELKAGEGRVAQTPAGVRRLVADGHEVWIESGAGLGSGYPDEEYKAAGAGVRREAADVYAGSELIIKVKEPELVELPLLRSGLVLFTYLHLAASPAVARALQESGAVGFAYETVESADGRRPLLLPMSQVAGRLAPQLGAHFLESPNGGRGVLLGGAPGVPPSLVTILGGGVVGLHAARMALGLGARVRILDVSGERLSWLDEHFGPRLETRYSNPETVAEAVAGSDLVIGAVLVTGARAPRLVSEKMVAGMIPGSVIVDVAIDQGGSVATMDRTTSHTDPVFTRYGVLHYGVPNIPGSVPRTSTEALAAATLPYIRQVAGRGYMEACRLNPELAKGLNVADGRIVHPAVAAALNVEDGSS